MPSLDTLLIILAVLIAVGFMARRFWKTHKKKEPCCGKGCGCMTTKIRSKITSKKA
ncbi:MAG: FeoB-associated Cys-rich membrane protein [Puniceicoccales bacterium]